MAYYTTNRRVPGTTVEEKEAYILQNEPLLRLRHFSLSENDDCIEDFLHNFIVSYNRKHATITVSKDISLQTSITVSSSAARHRSLTDMFLITKYYFPEATLREVIHYFWKMGENIEYQTCGTVNRRVYEHKMVYLGGFARHDANGLDELGYTIQQLKNINLIK